MGKIKRRKFFAWLGAGAAIGGAGIVYSRVTGYEELPGWKGKVLSKTEAQILIAACEVVLPEGTSTETQFKVAENVDAYLNTFAEASLGDVHLLFSVVEHLTPIGLHLSRFTKLNTEGKNDYLSTLDQIGSQLRLVYKGIRDLCLLGYYQQDAAWGKLKYGGPVVKANRKLQLTYAKLIAKAGTLPKSLNS